MSALSSAASITIHAALGAAFLFGTIQSAPTNRALPSDTLRFWVEPTPSSGTTSGGLGAPVIDAPPTIDLSSIPPSTDVLQPGASLHPTLATEWIPTPRAGMGPADGLVASLGSATPELL
ncbi:MAG TPA: hypothetical protein VFO67_19215, partial [Gemmatimonadales bacterium]|nr:hypothetical protein [Gemmatimonadales bacterium]